MDKLAKNKEKIIELLKNTERSGIERIIQYLEETDFFIAPASTKYHGNFDGGLADHSLNVYELFKKKNEQFDLGLSSDTLIITSILHDICKVNFYKKQTRWRKNDKGKWEGYEGYICENDFPIGHGEKSVIKLMQFIKLSKEEIVLIRWHMGGFESKENQKDISNSYNLYPAAVALHTSDLESSYMLEKHVEP
ncbi:HD domain-containing protein [Clostridium botulinum]|uniref:HD domain-containing protein n=1 Tax=Clostridium botulinum TaxID=1491 RepID=UPI001E2FCC26|nr:HD domain-containing protein [Clostridium botulinum]MCD3223804.1 HD domain-containing protein [Clostridium botulinum C/D]MCD3295296.1 HD domain-containing protein [Clostridium botulinum C/D]